MLKNAVSGMGGRWGLLQKAVTQILPSPMQCPPTRNRGQGKGRENVSCEGDFPLGLCWYEFQGHAAVLWNCVIPIYRDLRLSETDPSILCLVRYFILKLTAVNLPV